MAHVHRVSARHVGRRIPARRGRPSRSTARCTGDRSTASGARKFFVGCVCSFMQSRYIKMALSTTCQFSTSTRSTDLPADDSTKSQLRAVLGGPPATARRRASDRAAGTRRWNVRARSTQNSTAVTILANDEAVQNWYRASTSAPPEQVRLSPSEIGTFVADLALRGPPRWTSMLLDRRQGRHRSGRPESPTRAPNDELEESAACCETRRQRQVVLSALISNDHSIEMSGF